MPDFRTVFMSPNIARYMLQHHQCLSAGKQMERHNGICTIVLISPQRDGQPQHSRCVCSRQPDRFCNTASIHTLNTTSIHTLNTTDTCTHLSLVMVPRCNNDKHTKICMEPCRWLTTVANPMLEVERIAVKGPRDPLDLRLGWLLTSRCIHTGSWSRSSKNGKCRLPPAWHPALHHRLHVSTHHLTLRGDGPRHHTTVAPAQAACHSQQQGSCHTEFEH